MTKRIVILAAGTGVFLVAVFFLFASNPPAPNPEHTPRLVPAPNFTLSDYEGNAVRLEDFKGTPLVINSWAAWCPFCREELRDFAAIQQELGDKIVIIAINRRESLDVARRYSDELGVDGNLFMLLDPDDSFYHSINGFSMPETIFVDESGFIKAHKRGPMNKEEIRRRIQDTFGL